MEAGQCRAGGEASGSPVRRLAELAKASADRRQRQPQGRVERRQRTVGGQRAQRREQAEHDLGHQAEGALVLRGQPRWFEQRNQPAAATYLVAVTAVTACGAAGRFNATSTTVRESSAGRGDDGATRAAASSASSAVAFGSADWVVDRRGLGLMLMTLLAPSGPRRVSTGSNHRWSNSAPTPPFPEVSLFDFVGDFAPPVAFTIPGGTCRTDAPADAEVPDIGQVSAELDPGVEAPSVSVPAAGDLPAGSAVVPAVVARCPGIQRFHGASIRSALAVPVDACRELTDSESSAHATPGLLATATPTPNATANPPTRPTKRPALTTTSSSPEQPPDRPRCTRGAYTSDAGSGRRPLLGHAFGVALAIGTFGSRAVKRAQYCTTAISPSRRGTT